MKHLSVLLPKWKRNSRKSCTTRHRTFAHIKDQGDAVPWRRPKNIPVWDRSMSPMAFWWSVSEDQPSTLPHSKRAAMRTPVQWVPCCPSPPYIVVSSLQSSSVRPLTHSFLSCCPLRFLSRQKPWGRPNSRPSMRKGLRRTWLPLIGKLMCLCAPLGDMTHCAC